MPKAATIKVRPPLWTAKRALGGGVFGSWSSLSSRLSVLPETEDACLERSSGGLAERRHLRRDLRRRFRATFEQTTPTDLRQILQFVPSKWPSPAAKLRPLPVLRRLKTTRRFFPVFPGTFLALEDAALTSRDRSARPEVSWAPARKGSLWAAIN